MTIRCILLALLFPILLKAQLASNDSLALVIAPGLTPVVAKGQTEIGFFNAFATYKTDDTSGYRGAQLVNFLQLQHGFSEQNTFSAGVDLLFSNLRYGPPSEVGAFDALGKVPPNGVAAHALSAVGLRLRYIPFVRHYEFTLQGSLYFPVASTENRALLDEDRVRLSVQGNYSTLFAPGWYIVGQIGPQVRFSNNTRKQTTWELPLNVYLIRRIATTASGQRFYVFGSFGYFSSFEKRYKGSLRQVNWLLFAGLGGQWVISPEWSLSLGWQALPAYDDAYGIKKGSYSTLSLGVRYAGKL